MTTTETETLFRKVGRRYVPAYSLADWSYDKDLMPVGSFRLVHAYSHGGRGGTTAQAYDVAQAGIDAVTQWANQPKDTK